CLDGGKSDASVIETGLYLCQALGDKAHGMTVLDSLQLESPLMYDLSGALALIPQMNLMAEIKKALTEKAKGILGFFKEACEERKVSFETEIAEGIVYRTISQKSAHYDLTVLGRQGLHYELDKEFLGSTADRVLHHVKGPTLVVTHEVSSIKNPLLAYDASKNAQKALETSAKLCSDLKLPLTVLYVGDSKEKSQSILQKACEYLEPLDLIVQYRHEEGSSHEVVAAFAKTHQHDLIIMGARGHSGVLDFILGSTTQYTLWTGYCPVLVDR
ncbi:MAG: universal stress protein, partial [Deltaproteobacteria bacterium]|nr:universal stress protein [Deltaproteobacteria bacterium]